MDPAEALMAHKDLESANSLGMHWGTFQMTNEGRSEPRELLNKLAVEQFVDNFKVPDMGECFSLLNDSLVSCN